MLQVSRPGFYHVSFGLYICAAAPDPWSLLSRRALLGLFFVLFPVNLTVYAMNDLKDVDIDSKNPRKGGIYGAQASASELRSCIAIGLLACMVIAPLLTADIIWAFAWNSIC